MSQDYKDVLRKLICDAVVAFRHDKSAFFSTYSLTYGGFPDIDSLDIEEARIVWRRVSRIKKEQERRLPENQTIEEWLAEYDSSKRA